MIFNINSTRGHTGSLLVLLNISLFYNILVTAHAWLRVMRENHESDFVPDLFISRHSNHRCKWSIDASTVILDSAMHKSCPVTSFSVNITTPSDTFEAISSKFVRTRIPNSHVYGRRPISAHWANYNDVIGEQPYCTHGSNLVVFDIKNTSK